MRLLARRAIAENTNPPAVPWQAAAGWSGRLAAVSPPQSTAAGRPPVASFAPIVGSDIPESLRSVPHPPPTATRRHDIFFLHRNRKCWPDIVSAPVANHPNDKPPVNPPVPFVRPPSTAVHPGPTLPDNRSTIVTGCWR